VRILFPILLAAALSNPVLAQDPSKPQQTDKEEQARIRVEGAAGGTGNITPEQKAGAAVGAGPHRERNTSAARREPQEDSKKVESEKDERRDNRRP